MSTEFVRKIGCYDYHGVALCDSVKLVMAYDGSGRRISKTRMMKTDDDGDWYVNNVTHYTGIGTEVRESYFGGALDNAKVVVNMPQGLGRCMPEDAEKTALLTATRDENGRPTSWSVINPKFEWYLKNHQGESSENVLVHFHCRAAECCALRHNHLGSTMMVYGTGSDASANGVKAAYDYRATVVAMRTKQQVAKCCPPFGEQVTLSEPTEKVTENFTGKERDDETELNYFGARYLDPMLGLWTSVDPMREYHSPYIYLRGNPINLVDPTGMAEASDDIQSVSQDAYNYINNFKPTEKEISTFIETYDKFEGLTPKLLKGILENMYVQYEDNPRSETANGYYYPGDDREIYLTDRALNTKDSDWQMRIRSTIFHETAHYLNGLYGSINDGQKPYPDEKYQKKGFNGGSVELGKEFEYRAYGKDY
ncbi:MAG: RHS repeat-associated core domain-containing protein [Fibrobacter sp.]|nr:RHS repeat-associated core domain-containing protein [Fibrobacter sp.]